MSDAAPPVNLDALAAQAKDALRLADKATPARWHVDPGWHNGLILPGVRFDGSVVCSEIGEAYDVYGKDEQLANARLMAASRTLMPDLARAVLALVEQAKAKDAALADAYRKGMRGGLDPLVSCCNYCGALSGHLVDCEAATFLAAHAPTPATTPR